ncbi:MAG: cytochrome b [Castellaniella sp.]|nr:cytochrome b [Castellaniella sp.]TAN29522.1 MAG: cytochrome b [Castellaniella sp.]
MDTLAKRRPGPTASAAPACGDQYQSAVIFMHWLTLLLLIAVYAFIELKGFFPKNSPTRDAMQAWHELTGITVFGVVLARLLLRRLYNQTPTIVPEPPHWQYAMAKTMHVTLYAFLVITPILGWLTLSAKGELDLPLGLHLMPLISPDKALGRNLQEIHETIGNIGYYLIGLHALAALFHHYWVRDNTLRRMLPSRWSM